MNKNDRTLFLFDLDGTLLSTGGAGLRALERAFHHLYGISQVRERINPSGKTDPAIFRSIINLYLMRNMIKGEMDAISQVYLEFLQAEIRISSDFKICRGVEEILGALEQKPSALLGLGTGNLEKGARIKLEPSGLNKQFSFGGFGSDSEERDQLLRIAHGRAEKILNDIIPPEKTYVIGDTPLDVKAARKAGFQSIAVATGQYSQEQLKDESPNFLFQNLEEGFDQILKL